MKSCWLFFVVKVVSLSFVSLRIIFNKNALNVRVDHLLAQTKFVKPKCNIPVNLGLEDDFAKRFIKPNLRLNCTKKKEFVYVDYEKGELKLNDDQLVKASKCFYSFITKGYDDLHVKHTKPAIIPKTGVKFSNKNYIANVTCYHKRNNTVTYKHTHLWVPDFPKTNAKGPSVFILVIESLSRNSYLRFMKKTQQALKQINHFVVLEGLTKPAVNSFPNSMALIAGDAVNDASDNKTITNEYWDDLLDFLWKRFKKKGYVTAFIEDMVKIGLFDFGKKGFKNPPTDFFPRPFWLQPYIYHFDLYEAMKKWEQFCFGDYGSKVEVFLSHLIEFAKKMEKQKQPYFMYSFYGQVTHEDFSNFQLVDEFVASFFLKMSNYLSNTVFLLNGDHGPRFGPMSDTPLGKLESRLPLAILRIPDTLNAKYPHLRKVLKLNAQSLLTWFDVHRLFLDISNDVYKFERKESVAVLNPCRQLVSPERNCDQAKVPSIFCVCGNRFQVDEKVGSRERDAGKNLTKIVNSWITKTCSAFTFGKNNYVEIYLPPKGETLSSIERLNVSASMSNAKFIINAVIKRTAKDKGSWNEWQIDDEFLDVERLKQHVRQYYCFHNLPKGRNTYRQLTTEIPRTESELFAPSGEPFERKMFKDVTTKARKKMPKKIEVYFIRLATSNWLHMILGPPLQLEVNMDRLQRM